MTKLDHAKSIFENYYKTKSRKDIIAIITKRVNISPATASSYYQTAKKVVEVKLEKDDEIIETSYPDVFDAVNVAQLRKDFAKHVEKFFKTKKLKGKKLSGTLKAATNSSTKLVIRVDVRGLFK